MGIGFIVSSFVCVMHGWWFGFFLYQTAGKKRVPGELETEQGRPAGGRLTCRRNILNFSGFLVLVQYIPNAGKRRRRSDECFEMELCFKWGWM